MQIIDDIEMDLERTFIESPFFNKHENKQAIKRMLIAYSNYDDSIGYVQGMNFIAGVLLYHCGEVNAFWLLCTLMSTYQLDLVLKPGFPGLTYHNDILENLIKVHLSVLAAHFDKLEVTVNLFSTEWIMSIFLSCIPIELTNKYLDLFFESGWSIMYGVAIEVLRYFQSDLLSKKDPGDVIGQIKQARRGCEHLLAI